MNEGRLRVALTLSSMGISAELMARLCVEETGTQTLAVTRSKPLPHHHEAWLPRKKTAQWKQELAKAGRRR